MAINLDTSYPGKTTVDGNNTNGTFKNRTSDALKDGTPYEKKWASDVWGFLAHILGLASVVPNGAEENETNSQYYDALEGLVGRRAVEFETSRDLVFNVISSTQAQATFSRMSLLDSNFIPKYLIDQDITWTMPGDLEAGTSEKASTDYGGWVDSDGNIRIVPDLESTTDGTTAGKLVDSGATLLTDLVHAGDIVYNLTDLTQTTVSVDASAEGEVSLTDDIFVSGEDYKIVKMSPEGLGENRERLATAFNNVGSDFDDSWYTQIQEEKSYSGAITGADFDVSSSPAVTSVIRARVYIRQINDWTGKGTWKNNFNISYNVASASRTSAIMTISGVLNKNVANFEQPIAAFENTGNGVLSAFAVPNTATYSINHASSTNTEYHWSGDVELDKKPPLHN